MQRKRALMYPALVGAVAAALVVIPSAGSADGDPLILGSQTNSASASTWLNTAANPGLFVNDTGSAAIAIEGQVSESGPNAGVLGDNFSSSAGSYGVLGYLRNMLPGPPSAAVLGLSFSESDDGPGVWGEHVGGSGRAPGVLGHTNSIMANAAGVSGTISSRADYSGGVRGENLDSACCGFGVVGFHAGQGIGIGGYAPNGFGVFGWSPNNWAAWLDGAVTVTKDLHVNGTLYKGAGAFRIDNPLDPAHSYLQHSFVESP
jgi:hypothetical protein